MPDTSTVTHDPRTHRFEVRTDAGTGLLTYQDRGSALEILHTEVPDAAEGRGYAAALAVAALDFARNEGKQVIPSCPFVAAYIERHPSYADLVAR
jgi:predicted GNAT family acetyltransferase